MRVSSGFLTAFYNIGAQVLRRWHFMFSLVFVVIKHMHSDTGLKVTFVFSVINKPFFIQIKLVCVNLLP